MTVRNKAENRRAATNSTRRGANIQRKELQSFLSDDQREDQKYIKQRKREDKRGRISLTVRRQSGRNFSSPGSANYLHHSEYVSPLNVTPVKSKVTPKDDDNYYFPRVSNFPLIAAHRKVTSPDIFGKFGGRTTKSTKSIKSSKTIRRNRRNRRNRRI